jgi:DnaJ family protein A protein 2
MGGGGGMHDPFDIFQSFFGGGSPFGGMLCGKYCSHYNLFAVVNFHTWDSHSMLFCCEGGGSSRGRRQRRGEDVVHPLKVSLDELYNGTSKKLSLSRNVLCSKCNGYVKWLIFSV